MLSFSQADAVVLVIGITNDYDSFVASWNSKENNEYNETQEKVLVAMKVGQARTIICAINKMDHEFIGFS